jgi:hypothetical protein
MKESTKSVLQAFSYIRMCVHQSMTVPRKFMYAGHAWRAFQVVRNRDQPFPFPPVNLRVMNYLPRGTTELVSALSFIGVFTSYQCSGSVCRPPRSASGSVSLRYGSENPDPHPDPYQNITDPPTAE